MGEETFGGIPKDEVIINGAQANGSGAKNGFDAETKTLGPTKIIENYYLGNRFNAQRDQVEAHGITHVLNVSDKESFLPVGAKYELLNVPMCDFGSTLLDVELPSALRFIETALRANGVILVHCSHGVNRSASVTLAYLLLLKNMSLKEAWDLVKGLRPVIFPHDSYLYQLKQIELKHRGEISLKKEDTGPSIQEYLRELREKAAVADAGDGGLDEETLEKVKKIDNLIKMNDRYENVGARALSNAETSTMSKEREGPQKIRLVKRRSLLPESLLHRENTTSPSSGRTTSTRPQNSKHIRRTGSTVGNMITRMSMDMSGDGRSPRSNNGGQSWKPNYQAETSKTSKILRTFKGILNR